MTKSVKQRKAPASNLRICHWYVKVNSGRLGSVPLNKQ